MTKFEEEAIKEAKKSKVIAKSYADGFTASDIGLNIKLGRATHNFPWLEFAKNWHSDEEFQAEKDARKKEYEIHQDIYSKTSKKLNEAELEIANLKSQFQQIALPVVPEDVAEWIEILKTKGLKPLKNQETHEETGFTEETLQNIVFWISEHQEDYMRAWLDGYTVEKPQMFYLKNKLTGLWLMQYEVIDKVYPYDHTSDIRNRDAFTQQEIDSMQTGSYEQIPVEDGE